jgi:hypothetical protein
MQRPFMRVGEAMAEIWAGLPAPQDAGGRFGIKTFKMSNV